MAGRTPHRRHIDPDHGAKRTAARVFGLLLVVTGGIFLIVGMVDFFGSMDLGKGPPTKFWCCFVGMPLLVFGGVLLKFGFMGTVVRYAAGEIAPVATDTVNYVADGVKDSVGDLAEAVGRGLRDGRGGGGQPRTVVRCNECDRENDADASFCSGCGTALRKTKPCPSCGEMNDPDARFCDECGQAYG